MAVMRTTTSRWLAVLAVAVVAAAGGGGGPQDEGAQFYRYGPDAGDSQLAAGSSVSSPPVILAVPVKFFQQLYPTLFVNGNGLISFVTEMPVFYNLQFPLEDAGVAALYANVDTTEAGSVYYRESTEDRLLESFGRKIDALYPALARQVGPFRPRALFIATWHRVGYYPRGADKVNSFQVVLGSDGEESFVEFLYRKGGIEWVQAVATEGEGRGLPDARAQAGIIAPDGRLYTLKGSGTDQIKNIYRWSNTGMAGSYVFRIGNIGEREFVQLPQILGQDTAPEAEEAKSCALGQTLCDSKADCFDTTDSFCCKCKPGFYGNGRSCFMDGVAVRVNGKLMMSMNGEEPEEASLQAYVVTQDGRSYTAVSPVQAHIGYSGQLLEPLAGIIAWLFARPINNAKNGYQLTGGVLNHTVDINFDSGHRVHIVQRYLGLDVYDQLKMEAQVTGSLPPVDQNYTLELPDFQEWFTKTGTGKYRSRSKLAIKVQNSSDSYVFSKDQIIEFVNHCPDSNQELTHLRLKSARTYIIYNKSEGILRFSSTNKISKSSLGDDPCLVGQINCVANSTCIVHDDTFKCICNPGFEMVYNEDTENNMGCFDVNECAIGSAVCDQSAICLNEIGSYSCHCRPGYIGDGATCSVPVTSCEDDPSQCYIHNGYCVAPNDPEKCYCNAGYEKVLYDGVVCEDVDECLSQACHPDADCSNTEGGYHCKCKHGYVGDGYTQCKSVRPASRCDSVSCTEGSYCIEDEYNDVKCICRPGFSGVPPHCAQHTYGCSRDAECSSEGRCLYNETMGIYTCSCLPGYLGDGRVCSLSDETVIKTCLGDSCWCPPGYVQRDGNLCFKTETQESELTTKGCSGACDTNANCTYVQRLNQHECICNPGFEGDGYTCTEIEVSCDYDEICDINAICQYDELNTRHICICDIGYAGDGKTCYPTEECKDSNDCEQYETCEFNEVTELNECTCLDGYRKENSPLGGCYPSCSEKCHQDAVCRVIDGRAVCKCKDQLEGDGVTSCSLPVPVQPCLNSCSPHAHCLPSTDRQLQSPSPIRQYNCQCDPGYEGDGEICQPTCLVERSMCSMNANCVPLHGSYYCICSPGFVGNGTFCREAKGRDEFLLTNQGRATLRIPFNPTRFNRGQPIHVHQGQTAIGIAVDCIDERVYWSDIANHTITSSKFDGTDVRHFLTQNISSPEGLAVDWLSRHLYWTDSGLDTINMANLESGETRLVASTDLVNPRGITVHPWRRKVFWTDWNRDGPKIEVSDIYGNKREQLVVGPVVQLPNSLALDFTKHELCWADAGTSTIGCISLNDGSVRTVAKDCAYPFGLAITPTHYYWTDWHMNKIERASKSGDRLTAIDLPLGGDDKLYGIAAVLSTCPQ